MWDVRTGVNLFFYLLFTISQNERLGPIRLVSAFRISSTDAIRGWLGRQAGLRVCAEGQIAVPEV